MASANHLDDLLNTVYSDTEYGSVATQSQVSTPTTISSVTLTTTGAPGMIGIASPLATYKIVAVNDANNTITLNALINGASEGSQTDFVFGFGPNGILISPNTMADVANEYAMGENSIADSLLSILSPTPITAGMTETFTSGASSTSTTTTPPANGGLTIEDTTTKAPVSALPTPYTGPVHGLLDQYINVSPDSLNITANGPDYFLHSGSGNDALVVTSGTNVLDGGTGSNFLTGASGNDTFFVDGRGATTDTWSTIKGFHAGDDATLYGISPSDFALNWSDSGGAVGNTGLTLHATAAGKPTISMTMVGYTQADMTNGRLAITFGTDPASGSDYMLVAGH